MSKNKESFGGRKYRSANSSIADDIAALEASLQIDFDAFDQELAEISRNQATPAKSLSDAPKESVLAARTPFPGLNSQTEVPKFAVPPAAKLQEEPQAQRLPAPTLVVPSKPAPVETATPKAAPLPEGGGSLLDILRQQAESKQREAHQEVAKRTELSAVIDKGMRQVFSYLHDLSQQLNIVKPAIPRDYVILDPAVMTDLVWHEGTADFRTQSQSAQAMVETVSFNYQLKGKKTLQITREAHNFERLRTALFDFGLAFTCEEIRNARRHIERAEFVIRNEVNVNLRWQADFDKGEIVLETRNLERLGAMRYNIPPQSIDQPMLEAFGRLLLGQPNNFRELLRRS